MPLEQFVPFLPEIVLAVAGLVLLLIGIPMGRSGIRILTWLGVASLVGTGIAVWNVARPLDGAHRILGDIFSGGSANG